MKIVVVSNSQGSSSGISPSEAYPARMRAALAGSAEVHQLVVSGASIVDLRQLANNVVDITPDVIVLQVGIVEAARRILSVREKRLFRIFGVAGRRVTVLLHRHRKRVIQVRHRLGIDTRLYSPERFETELQKLLASYEACGAAIVLLEIPSFAPAYEREHFPLIGEDLDLFNGVLRRYGAVPPLPPETDAYSIWQPGTVHLTAAGHELVAAHILTLIEPIPRTVAPSSNVRAERA